MTGLSDQSDEAFTRSDRRTDWSARPRVRSTGLSDQSDRPIGQTLGQGTLLRNVMKKKTLADLRRDRSYINDSDTSPH